MTECIELAATDAASLLANFRESRELARANIRPGANGGADHHPSPRTLRDYLADTLRAEYAALGGACATLTRYTHTGM